MILRLSVLVFISLGIIPSSLKSQDLGVGYDMFSRKKPAFITKKDGSSVEGTVDKLKRKKGLIQSLIINVGDKKTTLNPAEIKYMYLAPSDLDKLGAAVNQAYTLDQWDREDVESEKIKDGYAYFENATVNLKGENQQLLMQLLNPGFSNKLRVFFDPNAQETGRTGIVGITVSGGLDKSYYVQKPGGEAYLLKKKEYKKDFENFYADCPEVLREYAQPDWDDFAKHVFFYSKNCE